jgi:hypothetical protein
MAAWTVPGAKPISEWGATVWKGIVDTCVSTAESVVTGVYGVLPTTTQTVQQLARDQIARGEATHAGASYVGSAGKQLSRLGIQNKDYEGSATIRNLPWVQMVNQALQQGKPVLAGVPDLSKLKNVNGQATGSGHVGHGFTIVGVDASGKGYLTADPNTPGKAFVDYTPSALQAANLSTLVIPDQAPAAVQSAAAPASNASSSGTSGSTDTTSHSGPQDQLAQWVLDNLPTTKKIESNLVDTGWRIVLVAIALILLAVGLSAFFFAGSGKGVTQVAASTAVKAAVA